MHSVTPKGPSNLLNTPHRNAFGQCIHVSLDPAIVADAALASLPSVPVRTIAPAVVSAASSAIVSAVEGARSVPMLHTASIANVWENGLKGVLISISISGLGSDSVSQDFCCIL